MLWRHLAYCDPLLEKLEKDAQPLDDDSDLECELEAFPTVSNEASAEASACVKVLMASNPPSDSCIERGLVIEAPMVINIPRKKSNSQLENEQAASSASGVNISIPVFVPTQLLPTVASVEGLDTTNACTNVNLPPRRKRKPWSTAEDNELFAAVQRFGEGNWTLIVKSDYKFDRTASQLSQRWNIIKKRQNHSGMKTGPQLSEIQLAARRAINMALDKHGIDGPKAASSLGRTCSGNISVQPTITADPPSSSTLTQNYNSTPTAQKPQFPRPQPFPARTLASGPDAVKAAAVAAGARIATPSAAAAIMKQQLKGAIHIKTTRPASAPGAHMGPDYYRAPCSRLSPKTQMNPAQANVGPVVQLNPQDVNVLANSPEPKPEPGPKPDLEPVKEDQVVVSRKLVSSLGSKDQDECINSPNMNLESEGQ